jgi:hypothetical protein
MRTGEGPASDFRSRPDEDVDGLRWVIPGQATPTRHGCYRNSFEVYLRPRSTEVDMPQASKKRRRQVHHLAARNLRTASPNLGRAFLWQVHRLSAASLKVEVSPRFGRTAQENEFANLLIDIISSSPNRRTMSIAELVSLAKNRFNVSEERAKTLRQYVILDTGANVWSKGGAPRGRRRGRTRG